MALLSSFEVLAEFLVPANVLPPGAENPFALQGYWVQVSLPRSSSVQSVQFNVVFTETTDFGQGAGQQSLQAQYIDANGNVNFYDNFFASTGRGFLNQQIGAGQTIIYGIQSIVIPSAAAALPQNGTGWRGTVDIASSSPGALIATPTQRLVYYNGSNIGTDPAIDAVVYPVPTFGGGTQI